MDRQLQEGWIAIAQSNFDSAITIASELLNDPKTDISHQAHRIMGMAYYRKASYTQAIPYFEHAIQLVNNIKDQFNLCMCYGLLGDTSRAEHLFQSIDSPWGLPTECYVSFAMFRVDQRNFEQAIALLEKIKLSYTLFGISDQTFLSIRGNLAFHYALDAVYYVLNKVAGIFNTNQWLCSFAEEMDEEGGEMLALVNNQIVHTKEPYLLNQPKPRLEYPLICRIEGVFHFEDQQILNGRMIYGKLDVNSHVAIYSMNHSAIFERARVSSLKSAQAIVQQIQAKEVAGIILDKLDRELDPQDYYFLVEPNCQSSNYFMQFPLI